LIGLTFGIVGSIFLTFGSLDNFQPIIDTKENRPLKTSLKDIRLLFEIKNNNMTQLIDVDSNVLCPRLRLITAEWGPWFILISFMLQFYVGYMDP
jgi:hypothetical protein